MNIVVLVDEINERATEEALILTTTDGRASAVPAVVADLLALPQVTHVRKLDVDAGRVRAARATENGEVTLDAPLPALVSVTEKINEPRYPSFKGIMAAKKKPVDTVDLDDLFPDSDDTAFLATRTRVLEPSRVLRVQPEPASRTTARRAGSSPRT
ncbi:hypothetical protein ABT147_01405 [Streptomyces sp. NPDC001868]|uniref:electron transfer flavoprotein subunit beta/FixA family protein n=1 Tax=Streptomyces sp. NPDC001868 TaxID=3154401 RepID=UPI003334528B